MTLPAHHTETPANGVRPPAWPGFALAALAYFGASELGWALWLHERHTPSLAMVLGVYLAAVLAIRRNAWVLAPLLLAVALLSQVGLHGLSPRLSLSYFALQTGTVFALAAALRRLPYSFEKVSGVFVFALSSTVACAGFFAPVAAWSNVRSYGDPFFVSWLHWAFAGTIATWLLAPPVLTFQAAWPRIRRELRREQVIEAVLLFGTLGLAVLAAFAWQPKFWAIPTVQLLWAIWAVLRFGSTGAGVAMLIICVADVALTVNGQGPFVRMEQSRGEVMLRLLAYLGLWSAFFMIVAAILSERGRALGALGTLNRELERRVADRTVSLIEASEALRESEKRLALAVKAAHAGTFDWNAVTNTNLWSDELLALYGVRREEFGGRYEDWLAALVPEDRPAGSSAVAAALASGQFIAEFRIRRRDNGEIRWMSGRGAMHYDADGRPIRMLGINVDVTEQKRAEEAVRETNLRKAALLDLTRAVLAKPADLHALGELVFARIGPVLNADLGFNYKLSAETGALHLVSCTGVAPEHLGALQRLELTQAFCGWVAGAKQPLMADAACIREDARGEFVRALGARAYACHPLVSSGGGLLGTLSFGSRTRDTFKPEEIDFLQTLCHVVAMAWERFAADEAIAQAKETAERANRAKDDFLAALSHELRTPLNPVLLLASELQQRPELPPELQADVATIRHNVELEARLIDDLLDLTRITRGKLNLDLQPVGVRGVLEETLEILRADFSAKELRMQVDFAAEPETVLADATRLEQVFWNVLRNAVKFTPRGGTITIRTRTLDAGRVAIEIADTGAGIEPALLEKIFNAFQQGGQGHQFGGLGLGLAIARSIVEMHRGVIRASSAGRDQGATFTVELPIHTAVAAEGHGPNGVSKIDEATAPRGLRILLVEDHEPTRSTLKKLLERRQHHVTAAEDLAGARALVAAERFDLLLSDLGLPDGDGSELMREISDRKQGPPGIAISGFGMDEDLRRSSSAGFFAHLVKPVDISLLERTMAALAGTGALPRRN